MVVVVGRGFAVGVDGVVGWGAGIVTGLEVGEYVGVENIGRKIARAVEMGMGKNMGFGREEECCYGEDWRCD